MERSLTEAGGREASFRAGDARAKSLRRLFRKDGAWAALLLLPNLLGFLAFTLIPVFASFFLSFASWDMLTPIEWTGITNYIELWKDETFIKVFWNTIYFAGASVPLGIACSLFLAVALDRIELKKFYRAAYFLPVVSSMVAIAVVWQFIYNPEYGLFNYVLSWFGIRGPQWLTSTVWAMPAVILTSVWKNLGFNMLIFLAGLQGISDDYYEAASLDGARWYQKFLYITVPLLSPTTFFVTVMSFIASFQVFDTIFLMTQGGPARSTSVIVHYLYEHGFKYFNMGYASAMAYVLFFMMFLITVIQFWRQRKWGVYY
ncbi:carbohydrate ABC transporter permease [Paenibacillus sp.]|uniref:carbohydrate ABC transporter permease n=1 Tax=Paenibacillus sp. TaxID=58172 RepID=UPI0035C7E909